MGNETSSGSSGVYWKVNDENKYFRPLSGNTWGEFENGRHVFSFELVSKNGDEVVLRKTDGSVLSFNSSRVIMHGAILYYGSWMEGSFDAIPQPQTQTQTVYRSSGGG